MESRFAQLREWLTETPTPETWNTMLSELAGWPDDERELIIDYIHSHVTHWPDEIRTLPNREWLQLGMGRLVRMYRPHQKKWKKNLLLHLQQMPNLTILDLNNRHIGDELLTQAFEDVSLPALRTLDLLKNKLQIDTMRRMESSGWSDTLRELHLSNNNFDSVAFLEGFPCLENLTLNEMAYLNSLQGLKDSQHLRKLALFYCESLRSLATLSNSPSLQEMSLEYLSLEHVESLRFPHLQSLELNSIPVKNVPGFPETPALRELSLRSLNSVTSLDGLSRYTVLESMKVYLHSLETFQHFQQAKHLKHLHLSLSTSKKLNTSDIPVLESLETLHLHYNGHETQLALPQLPNLRRLHLFHFTSLKSLGSLLELPALEELYVHRCGHDRPGFQPALINTETVLHGREAIQEHIEAVG